MDFKGNDDMMDYSEKRDFMRMPVHCPVSIRDIRGELEELAELLDLSATGVRFVSSHAIDEGARLQLMVKPECTITPPLEAQVSVVRCNEVDNGFDIAASIDLMAPAIYPDED